MASSLFPFKTRPVEIVINDYCIRYMELKNSNDPIPLKWGERYLPPGIVEEGKIVDFKTLLLILEECIDTWKIKRRKVRYLVPDPYVTIRRVTLPTDVKLDEIEGYLFLEIGESIHLPFEDPVFDFIVLPEQEKKREILLFAAHREHVLSYAELFSDAKLQPVAADLSSLALYRLYHLVEKKSNDENLLVIQFDLNFVNMSIFENEMPFFIRYHQLEFDQTVWQARLNEYGTYEMNYNGDKSELALQLDEVAKEVKMIIDFYQYSLHKGNNRLTKILITGDHPYLATISTDLQKRFEIPVEILESTDIITAKNSPLPASHHLVMGLALKEV